MYILTGVKPSGTVHFGNIVGALYPSIELIEKDNNAELLLCVADYHALTGELSLEEIRIFTRQLVTVVKNMAIERGVVDRVHMYRQSAISSTFMLYWKLACLMGRGQMERLHSVKEYRQAKREMNIGTYTYPILMAADILTVNPEFTIVSTDQKQHIEYCKILTKRYCNRYSVDKKYADVKSIICERQVRGSDGRKMSKSYGNTITPFMDKKSMRAAVMKSKTDSSRLGGSIQIEGFPLVDILNFYCSAGEYQEKKRSLASGTMGWREIKEFTALLLEKYSKIYLKEIPVSKIVDALIQGENKVLELCSHNPFFKPLS